MKKLLLFLAIGLVAALPQAFAQDRNNEDEVVHLDQMSRYNSVPNQLLVKFQDYSDISVDPKDGTRFVSGQVLASSRQQVAGSKNIRKNQINSDNINSVLEEYTIVSIEQLLPNFVMPKEPRRSPSFGGKDVVEKDLSQIYLITLSPESAKNYYELIEALQPLAEVEFAEPNYICYALGAPKEGEMLSEALVADGRRAEQKHAPKSTFSTNDPMYSLQWGFDAVGLDQLLMQPKLDSTAAKKVIAIIDTGVDIDHPDLADNIWTNTRESNGATRQDDDGNGFIDDIHGWDFVNQTAEMHDFNSHGTHCAGIAAAVGGNNIGIIGADPDALIMPVAVMQSDGTGDVATIVRGINYAAQNGADIISMSIGTYAYSVAMEQALAQAYQTAVLVGAAGNDALGMTYCCPLCADMYPGAFTFVFGVQATDQTNALAGFSNYDCTGPSFSVHNEEQLYNYELSAPGVGIMSTVPNGGYRSYNGTSMATPLVAGGIASLLERRNYQTKEILFGDLINYSEEFHHVNLAGAYAAPAQAPAILQHVAYEVNDTAYGDSSMYADAGEHIQLYPTVRTVWGPADSIEVWLEFQEFEDTTTLTFINNHVAFGRPLSSYAKGKSINPIEFRVREDIHDGRHIQLTLCAASTDAQDTLRHDFTLPITNGVKLHGMVTHNDTLWPNVQYLVTGSYAITEGAELVIMPGTTLKFKDNIRLSNAGKLKAIGTPDSMITFTKTEFGQGWGGMILNTYDTLKYCIIEYSKNTIEARGGSSTNEVGYIDSAASMPYRVGIGPYIENSIFRNSNSYLNKLIDGLTLTEVNIESNICSFLAQSSILGYSVAYDYVGLSRPLGAVQANNVVNNKSSGSKGGVLSVSPYDNGSWERYLPWSFNVMNNIDRIGQVINLSTGGNSPSTLTPRDIYLGTAREEIARKWVDDFEYPGNSGFVFIDLTYMATEPCHEAHGIVWKVVVDGYDAQDEFDSIPPLGVGTHTFQVYFNRRMNTEIDPFIAMGVRPPYTQTAITEKGQWNDEGTIYTVYHNIKPTDAIDGLNRIYVANAKDDENFEIPYENQRFNVYINCAGSMSTGFQATPGIGKVELEWNNQEMAVEDFLGFNMYRYQYEQQLTNRHYDNDLGQYVYDTVIAPGDTVRLNQSLIVDTLFTDYDVVPGARYYYFYKILRSSLTENSPSKTVSCVPYSAIRGDANGSMNVDVLDVVATVNYVTGQNPQPFLYDAADVNGDSTINVLDIVGIINIILNPGGGAKDAVVTHTAIYTIEDGILYVNSPVAMAGLQFSIANCTASDIEWLAAVNGFEKVATRNADGSLMVMAYNMNGAVIPAGKQALLRIGDKELTDIVLADPEGNGIIALKGDNLATNDIITVPAQIMRAFPNPFEKEVTITFAVGSDHSQQATLVMTDLVGRKVGRKVIETPNAGRYSYIWNAEGVKKGVYFISLYLDDALAHTTKVVVK
ncbi:MAG: S8 family serine peptidase [Bacteroidales bacterium]|nr:S8 family serine peptidase [Bacteroidales bacterium]